jgi:hypothetical protein
MMEAVAKTARTMAFAYVGVLTAVTIGQRSLLFPR